MDEPLFWNTLDDAAAWLARATGETWTAQKVLDTEIKRVLTQTPKNGPAWTNIKAALPRGTTFGRYRFDKAGQPIREGESEWDRPIPLALIKIQQLLVQGETRAGLVRSPDDDNGVQGAHIFIDPIEEEHIVNIKMTGISERDLKSLLAFFEWRKKKMQEKKELEKKEQDNQREERPLRTTERTTLLTIIAALAKEAKISLSHPSKAAELIANITERNRTPISKRAIEEHLKRIPDALERRTKS